MNTALLRLIVALLIVCILSVLTMALVVSREVDRLKQMEIPCNTCQR